MHMIQELTVSEKGTGAEMRPAVDSGKILGLLLGTRWSAIG